MGKLFDRRSLEARKTAFSTAAGFDVGFNFHDLISFWVRVDVTVDFT
jgi:hypothetical protein